MAAHSHPALPQIGGIAQVRQHILAVADGVNYSEDTLPKLRPDTMLSLAPAPLP